MAGQGLSLSSQLIMERYFLLPKIIDIKNKFPRRKNPRLKDFDYSLPYAYFITICTKDKINFFKNNTIAREIIDCLISEKKRLNFSIYAYCLMPNHLHLLLSPSTSKKSVSDFIGGFKSKSTRLAWKNKMTKLWQNRFYDHILRSDENLREVATYILNNPVRKNLVTSWDEYEFCRLLDEIPL